MQTQMSRNFLHAIVTQGLFSLAIGQTLGLVLTSVSQILIYSLNPRFILSVRELYAHTLHGQCLDTGFGMLSDRGLVSTFTNIGTTPHFVDGLGEELDESEEIPMSELRRKRYVA